MTKCNGYLLRPMQAASHLCCSVSTLYRNVRKGVVPPPMAFGAHGVAWLSLELDSILCARSCGYTANELQTLVTDIVLERTIISEKK